jgi:hypothetical protein
MLQLLLALILTFVGQTTTRPDDGTDALLARMQTVGEELRTLQARVTLDDFDATTGSNPVRIGDLTLRRDEDGKADFHVVFPVVRDGMDGPVRREKVEYLLLDGRLVDRNYRARTQVTRRLSPERAAVDPFNLGEGPFPLPIGQAPEDVRRQFEIERYDPADPDANDLELEAVEGAVRLRLVPRPGSRLDGELDRIEIDLDPATGFPMRVHTLDAAGINLRTAILERVQRNAELPPDAFELEDVDLSQWNVTVEEME